MASGVMEEAGLSYLVICRVERHGRGQLASTHDIGFG